MGKSKQSITTQFATLYQFFATQIENKPQAFSYTPNLIDTPTFFTMRKFQEFLNNPLLMPEWFKLVFQNQPIPLENHVHHRIAQRNELRFIDKSIINEYLEKGAAIVLEGIEIMDKNINDFISKIDALQPCASSDAVVFFSQKQQEAYRGHRDSDDVMAIQLQGKKCWKIYEPQQRRYFGNTPLTEEEMGTVAAEITMSPGDALYLRAGVPHIVHTPFDYSLHLSFDIKDRSLNIEQITSEANIRYNHACEESFAPASKVVENYINMLNSDKFQADLKHENETMAKQAKLFRKIIGDTSVIDALTKYIK